MSYVSYANYVIFFTDPAEYTFAIGAAGGTTVLINPTNAQIQFGTLIQAPGPGIDKGMYFIYPYTPGTEIGHPEPSGVFMDPTVDFMTVPGQTYFGQTGPTMLLYWSATLVMQGVQVDEEQTAPIPRRRWAQGFEYPGAAEGGTNDLLHRCRDASRVVDGLGWAIRNPINVNLSHAVDQYRPAFTTNQSWERLYFRVRKFGLAKIDLWKSESSPSPASGIRLWLNPDGSISIYNVNSASVEALLGSTAAGSVLIDVWNKYDIFIIYNDQVSSGQGLFFMYQNGELVASFTVPDTSGGIGQHSSLHINTVLGTVQVIAANIWEIDFDDWINSDIPMFEGVISLTSIDLLMGSHVRKVFVIDGDLGTWAGQTQFANQMMAPSSTPNEERLLSSTSGDLMSFLTNASDNIDAVGQPFAAVAFTVSKFGSRLGSANGTLGYNIAGGPDIFSTIVESTSEIYNSMMYIGTGVDVIPQSIVPLVITHTKGASSSAAVVKGIGATVEYIGNWGAEDYVGIGAIIPEPKPFLLHNAWYPDLTWAFLGPVPDGPVAAFGDTYVGNGTQQLIELPGPVCFLMVRRVGTTGSPIIWFGSGLGGHIDASEATVPAQIPTVFFDTNTLATYLVAMGENPNLNATGVTYEVIGFIDPGMQFNLCGAFIHNTLNTSAVNPLINDTFTPTFGMFQFEVLTPSSNVKLAIKGPGNAGTTAITAAGVALANATGFAQGVLTSKADLHGDNQTTYSVWKTGNNCSNTMVQIMTYTGDGTGDRVIALTPVTTRFPLFAYVQPHNGLGYIRDPSDAGASSRDITSGSASATAIKSGGVDTLTVGATLNALGIVYEVFVIPGDAFGWNNGLFFGPSCNPTCILPDDDSCDPPVIPPGVIVFPNGGLEIGETNIPLTMLKDISGIYTIVPGKTNDTLYDRQTGQTNVDLKIPDPGAKTGFIGG